MNFVGIGHRYNYSIVMAERSSLYFRRNFWRAHVPQGLSEIFPKMVKHIDGASSYKLLRVSCAHIKCVCAVVTYFRQWCRKYKARVIFSALFVEENGRGKCWRWWELSFRN